MAKQTDHLTQSPYATTALTVFFFLTFYLTLWSGVSLLFTFADYGIPDDYGRELGLVYGNSHLASILRWHMARAIVCAPLVYFSRRLLLQQAAKETQLRMRFIYLTLFLAAAVVTYHTIGLVQRLLDGECGLRFIVKFVAIVVVAYGVYGFYLPEIRPMHERSLPPRTIARIGLGLLVALIAGAVWQTAPWRMHSLMQDAKRMQYMACVACEAQNYACEHGGPAPDHKALMTFIESQHTTECSLGYFSCHLEADERIIELMEPYPYRRIDAKHFEICGHFANSADEQRDRGAWAHLPRPFAEHPAGDACATVELEPRVMSQCRSKP